MVKPNSRRKKKAPARKRRGPIKSRRPLVSALLFLLLTASLIITLYLVVGSPKSNFQQSNTTTKQQSPTTGQNLVKKPGKVVQKPRQAKPIQPSSHLIIYRVSSDFRQLTKHHLACDKQLTDKAKVYRIIELLTLPGKHGTQPALPRTTSLLSLAFALPLITIDLSGDIQKSLVNSGATDEMLTVACLTNSLLANFTQFNSLQILLDGKRCNTLAGHIDISRPLGYQTGY